MTSSTPPEEVSKDVSSDDTTATTRALITRLYDEREAMEQEMAAISARLSRDGMRGALVDDEGFPIPDVDLYAVRADRGRYATLRNDHDDITDAIERAMASLHAVASATRGVGAVDVNATMNPRAARVPSERVAARHADAILLVASSDDAAPAPEDGRRLQSRLLGGGGYGGFARRELVLLHASSEVRFPYTGSHTTASAW